MKLNIDDAEPTKYFVCKNLIKCRYDSPVLISTFKNKIKDADVAICWQHQFLLKNLLHLMSQTTLTNMFLEKSLIQRFDDTEFSSIDIDAKFSRKINVKIMQRKSNAKILLFAQGKED